MSSTSRTWTNRFIWFCKHKGLKNPADFIVPGNRMGEFAEWSAQKTAEFQKISPKSFVLISFGGISSLTLSDFAAFNNWMEDQYGKISDINPKLSPPV